MPYQGVSEEGHSDDILRTDVVGNPKVTAIPAEAIAKRMKWNQHNSADEDAALASTAQ